MVFVRMGDGEQYPKDLGKDLVEKVVAAMVEIESRIKNRELAAPRGGNHS